MFCKKRRYPHSTKQNVTDFTSGIETRPGVAQSLWPLNLFFMNMINKFSTLSP